MMVITAPENVVRAIAAAPQTQIRDITLGALGFKPNLEVISPELRQAAEKELNIWFEMGDTKQGELPV